MFDYDDLILIGVFTVVFSVPGIIGWGVIFGIW